ncbi:MAG: LEA type 2 family protein [Planctomycetota bacterium]
MRPIAILLFLLSVALAGCSSHTTPTLHVVSAGVTERTPDGLKLEFALDAENPNDVPLTLREARYSLSLDGKTVFTGSRAPTATLARRSTQRLILPAVIPVQEAAQLTGDVEYRLRGSLVYITPGELSERLFDARIRRPDADFGERGIIEFGPNEQP